VPRLIPLLSLLTALTWASAAPATDLSDPVPGHPGLTYFDLVKLVVPDLAKTADGATGHKVVPFHHIEGDDMRADPGDAFTFDSASLQVMAIPGQPDRLIMLTDLGGSDGNVEEVELLGLFALDGTPRLIDVVEVGNDRWTAIDTEHAPPMLAAGAPLIVVDSGHNNSNENYNDAEMIFIRGQRFALIDSIFTYNDQNCGYRHIQDSAYAAAPAPGPYRSVAVTIKDTVTRDGDDCGDQKVPPASATTYRGTYVWDAAHARFVTHSAQLKALDAKNSKWLNAP
jgi:hypothetical protein